MKKLFTLIITAMLVLSCTSKSDKIPEGDTIENNTKDIIVGTWELVRKDGVSITNDCEKKDRYTFNEDATYTFDDYNAKSESCAKDEKTSFKGTWMKNKTNTYNLKKHGFTGPGADYNIDFTEGNNYLTFPSNGLTYKRK